MAVLLFAGLACVPAVAAFQLGQITAVMQCAIYMADKKDGG